MVKLVIWSVIMTAATCIIGTHTNLGPTLGMVLAGGVATILTNIDWRWNRC